MQSKPTLKLSTPVRKIQLPEVNVEKPPTGGQPSASRCYGLRVHAQVPTTRSTVVYNCAAMLCKRLLCSFSSALCTRARSSAKTTACSAEAQQAAQHAMHAMLQCAAHMVRWG